MPALSNIENPRTFSQFWGVWLRKSRKAAGWSQIFFAGRAQVTQATVSAWERGKSVPDLEQFCRVCQALQVAPGAALSDIVTDYHGNLPLFRRRAA